MNIIIIIQTYAFRVQHHPNRDKTDARSSTSEGIPGMHPACRTLRYLTCLLRWDKILWRIPSIGLIESELTNISFFFCEYLWMSSAHLSSCKISESVVQAVRVDAGAARARASPPAPRARAHDPPRAPARARRAAPPQRRRVRGQAHQLPGVGRR